MAGEDLDLGRAVLREISPWRRFFRNWWLYFLTFSTTLCIIMSPGDWVWYALIFLAGTQIMAMSVIFEEAIDNWLSKLSKT